MKQLLILSGKGGTGKTTVAGAFIKLSGVSACADCDVDAPNLHLILKPSVEPQVQDYFGLSKAKIDNSLCINCGACLKNCRFDAVRFDANYYIEEFFCEGCGVCEKICPKNAITMIKEPNGEYILYNSDKVFSTAKLKMGSGTSGKLVDGVKKQLYNAAVNTAFAIIDGSPGIGCPVIASLSGVDMALIVAEPSISGISDMERIIKTAKYFGTEIAVCVNKYDINIANTEKIEAYCIKNDLPFVGRIPYDVCAVKAINEGKSIADTDCISGTAIREVYANTIKLMQEKGIIVLS